MNTIETYVRRAIQHNATQSIKGLARTLSPVMCGDVAMMQEIIGEVARGGGTATVERLWFRLNKTGTGFPKYEILRSRLLVEGLREGFRVYPALFNRAVEEGLTHTGGVYLRYPKLSERHYNSRSPVSEFYKVFRHPGSHDLWLVPSTDKSGLRAVLASEKEKQQIFDVISPPLAPSTPPPPPQMRMIGGSKAPGTWGMGRILATTKYLCGGKAAPGLYHADSYRAVVMPGGAAYFVYPMGCVVPFSRERWGDDETEWEKSGGFETAVITVA